MDGSTLGIAPVAIIDRQLPFEYTIASRSTDVMVPIPPAPTADSAANVMAEWSAVYDAHNEVACLMLESMNLELHRQFENSSPYEMLLELKSMFKKQARMKGYVVQLERLGYVLPHDLSVSLILNGLTSDFAGFVRNYNMHNMGKTIGELHAMLMEYEKGLPIKAATPQVMAIHGGRIQKANRKSQNAKGKGKRKGKGKDKSYVPKPKNPKPNAKEHPAKMTPATTAKRKMTRKPFPHRLERATDLLGLIHTNVCRPLRHVSRQGEYISQEFKDYLKACGIDQQLSPPYTLQHNGVSERRNRTLLDMVRSMMNLTTLPLSFWGYALEAAARILNMVWGCEAIVKRDTPYKLQQRSVKCIFIGYPKETMGYYFYFPLKNKIVVTREIPIEVEGFEPPHKEEAPVCRSERPHRAPNRLCLNVDVEEHSLGDLNEPANYKAAMVDCEETFLPVADIRAIRILIAIAAFYDYEIWQMDVKLPS
nr:hypothetical protein [Tanacetum cinerariifolium]